MGSPLPLYTPLPVSLPMSESVPSPKTEACLNTARVEMGVKGSEWDRRKERKRENE